MQVVMDRRNQILEAEVTKRSLIQTRWDVVFCLAGLGV